MNEFVQQQDVDPFYTTPRVLVPGKVWVGAKETAVALDMVQGTAGKTDSARQVWHTLSDLRRVPSSLVQGRPTPLSPTRRRAAMR